MEVSPTYRVNNTARYGGYGNGVLVGLNDKVNDRRWETTPGNNKQHQEGLEG